MLTISQSGKDTPSTRGPRAARARAGARPRKNENAHENARSSPEPAKSSNKLLIDERRVVAAAALPSIFKGPRDFSHDETKKEKRAVVFFFNTHCCVCDGSKEKREKNVESLFPRCYGQSVGGSEHLLAKIVRRQSLTRCVRARRSIADGTDARRAQRRR